MIPNFVPRVVLRVLMGVALTSKNKFCCIVLSLSYNLSQRSFEVTISIIDKELRRYLKKQMKKPLKLLNIIRD